MRPRVDACAYTSLNADASTPAPLLIDFQFTGRLLVLVKKLADREWKATDYPGIERSLFRNNETGGQALLLCG